MHSHCLGGKSTARGYFRKLDKGGKLHIREILGGGGGQHEQGSIILYSTGVFAHGYLRAFTSESHVQVSETARTGAAAGHSGESGRECRHASSGGLSPCGDHTPRNK